MSKLLIISIAINILLGCYSAGAYQAKHEVLPYADIVIPQPKARGWVPAARVPSSSTTHLDNHKTKIGGFMFGHKSCDEERKKLLGIINSGNNEVALLREEVWSLREIRNQLDKANAATDIAEAKNNGYKQALAIAYSRIAELEHHIKTLEEK